MAKKCKPLLKNFSRQDSKTMVNRLSVIKDIALGFCNIDDDKFRLGAGFEMKLPVGNAGGNDKGSIVSGFFAVSSVVGSHEDAYGGQRDQLTTMSMSGKYQIYFCGSFCFVIIGLMV